MVCAGLEKDLPKKPSQYLGHSTSTLLFIRFRLWTISFESSARTG